MTRTLGVSALYVQTHQAKRTEMTKSVYVDTSVVSYLTARPARDVVTVARQVETIEWWTVQSSHFEIFSSEVAIEEARQGNEDAARRRLDVLSDMTILVFADDGEDLARALLAGDGFPANAEDDARHVAVAAVNNIDYLLTWNFTHLANTVAIPLIGGICEQEGYNAPIITTPNQLKGGLSTLEDEIMRELHRVRAKIASEHGNDREKVDAYYKSLRSPGFTYGIPGRTFETEEELDNHIEERNREFQRRQSLKAASEGLCPPG